MNVKTTLALLVLLALIGAAVFFLDSDPTGETSRTPPGQLFESVAVEDIDSITIVRDGLSATIVRDNGGWKQTQPVSFSLIANAVDTFAGNILLLQSTESFTPGIDGTPSLEDVGLVTPRGEVTVDINGNTTTLLLGKISLGGNAYAMKQGGNTVEVISNVVHNAVLDRPVSAWRDKRLAIPTADTVEKITLNRSDATVNLFKIDGRWYLDEAATERADATSVDALLTGAGAITVNDFVSDTATDLPLYGLDEPQLTLTVTKPSGESITIRIGEPVTLTGEGFFATYSIGSEQSPVAFTVPNNTLAPLIKTADDLRDARVFTTDADRVTGVTFKGTNDPWGIVSSEDGFAYTGSRAGEAIDTEAVLDLIDALTAVGAVRFIESFQPTAEAATVEVLKLGSDQPEMVRLYVTPDGPVAVRDGETIGYGLSAEGALTLTAPSWMVLFRTVADDPVDSLTLTDQSQDVVYVFKNDRLVGFDSFERPDYESLVTALLPLRTTGWTSDPVDTADFILEIQGNNGATRRFAFDTSAGIGREIDAALSFHVTDEFAELLGREYRPRTIIPETVDQIQSVTVGDTTITRDVAGNFLGTANQQTAATLFDTLAGLSVKHYTPKREFATPPADAISIQTLTLDGKMYTLELLGDDHYATITPALADGLDAFFLDENTTKALRESAAVQP